MKTTLSLSGGKDSTFLLLELIRRGTPPDEYEKLDRVSCACCAAKNLKELRNIYNDMPEVWADLQARQSKTSRPFKGPGKSVGDLAIRFELEKEYIAAGLSITSRDFYTCLADRLKQRGGGTA